MSDYSRTRNWMKDPDTGCGLGVVLVALTMLVGCQAVSSGQSQNQTQQTPPAKSTLALSISSVSFGNVVVAASKTLTVTATNNGSAEVSISSATATASQFRLSSPALPAAIAAGQSATLSITFIPTTTGNATASLALASDASNGSVTLSLSGSGVAPSQLAVNPTALSWGDVTLGTTQSKSGSLTNAGGSTLSVSQASVTGSVFSLTGLTLPLTLAPGASANFNVVFAPSAAGAVSGNVAFTSDVSSSALNLPLSGVGATAVAPQPPGQGIPAEYLGQNLHPGVFNGAIPWPTIPFGSIRLWDTMTSWAEINTSDSVYDFSVLDASLALAAQNGKTDFLYTFGSVPTWASSDPTDQSCVTAVRPPGSCDPPYDLNPDGTGPDLLWKNFVTAVVTHAAGKIQYWEMWNEPDVPTEWTGTMAQMARMAQDAYTIIKSVDPNALVTTPTPVDDGGGAQSIAGWMSSYLAVNGGNYADIVTFHGYVSAAHGEPPENIASVVQTVDSNLVDLLSSKPRWDTEASWGKDPGYPDPDLQAAFVARMYLLQWSNGVQRFYWYQYGNTGFGTLWTDSGLAPAGIAYEQVYDWMVGATLASPCSNTGTVWTCNITKPGGIQEQAVWDSSQSCSNGSCTTSVYTPATVYTEYADLAGTVTSFTAGTTVPIGAKPILLLTP